MKQYILDRIAELEKYGPTCFGDEIRELKKMLQYYEQHVQVRDAEEAYKSWNLSGLTANKLTRLDVWKGGIEWARALQDNKCPTHEENPHYIAGRQNERDVLLNLTEEEIDQMIEKEYPRHAYGTPQFNTRNGPNSPWIYREGIVNTINKLKEK